MKLASNWKLALITGIQAGALLAAEPLDPAEEAFRRAERHVTEGSQARAIDAFGALVRHHPKSNPAPRAQLRIAELYARNREFSEAFESAQKLIDKYPASELFSSAIEIQFAVSERVMEEYRRRRLKADKSQRDLPSRESSSEMMRVILANGRQTEFAPRALYRLAATLDEERRGREAIEKFNHFLDQYPDHALADDAAFQVAFIDYRLARDSNRERGAQERARLAFEDFIVRHPGSEKGPEARHLLGTLQDWETQRLVQTARFYEKRGDVNAAVGTYRAVIKNEQRPGEVRAGEGEVHEAVLEPRRPVAR